MSNTILVHDAPAYPVTWQAAVPAPRAADTACSSLLRLATMGAVIAGSAAAAANLRRVSAGEALPASAVTDTARSAAIGAAATAAAGAVAGVVADQGLLRLGLMFAVGTAVVYGLEQWSREAGRDDDE